MRIRTVRDLLAALCGGWRLIDRQTHPPSYQIERTDEDGTHYHHPVRASLVIAAERRGLITSQIRPGTVGDVTYQLAPSPETPLPKDRT